MEKIIPQRYQAEAQHLPFVSLRLILSTKINYESIVFAQNTGIINCKGE